jgi:hypothetical protein
MKRLTKEQAAIIGAYTGITCSSFDVVNEYAEKKFCRPIFTHEFAYSGLMESLREASQDDFLSISYKGE